MKKVVLIAVFAVLVLGGFTVYSRAGAKADGPYDVTGARANARKFVPQITQASAVSLARNQFPDKKVITEKATLSLWPDSNGKQVLRWVIDMDFEKPANQDYYTRGGEVVINAATGEVTLVGIK